VFYEGEVIRSCYHGLGEITLAGKEPRVRFIDGRESVVPGDTIRLVPQDVYDAEIRNRTLIERYLILRIYGSAPSPPASLPKPEFDLVAAMMRDMQSPPLPFVDSSPPDSGVLYFD